VFLKAPVKGRSSVARLLTGASGGFSLNDNLEDGVQNGTGVPVDIVVSCGRTRGLHRSDYRRVYSGTGLYPGITPSVYTKFCSVSRTIVMLAGLAIMITGKYFASNICPSR
jgi:hypothetical protein